MGRKIILFFVALLFISVVSAEMKLMTPLKKTYNLGESISLPIKIVANSDTVAIFSAEMLCNGVVIALPIKYPVVLAGGEEQTMNTPVPLVGELIGNLTGICKIKVFLDEEYLLTKEFKISDILSISLTNNQVEFSPGDSIIVEGWATKESGEGVNGFAVLTVLNEDLSTIMELSDSVQGGYFLINSTLSEDLKAGQHPVKLYIYERDTLGGITNEGELNYNIAIKQVPTSLEIAYDSREVEPGKSFDLKAILHDQTGEKIESTAFFMVTNDKGELVEATEKLTEEVLEIEIPYNQAPARWEINVTSSGLFGEDFFVIKEKKAIKTELINSTIFVTNIGNVPYAKNILVKIGNESLNLNVSLGVDENYAYLLTAPDGEYQVEIIADGKSQISSGVMLTGKEIDIRGASEVGTLMTHPIVWVFIIAIFGSVALILFRKWHKQSFFEYFKNMSQRKSSKKELEREVFSDEAKKNKAELSLSIKGDKENVSVICLKLKNFDEIDSTEGNAKATIQRIISLAEMNKAYTYENQDNLFFIFSSIKTKTFKNETSAIEVANKIVEILNHNNKTFKQKIDFGIALNYGAIIAKPENAGLKFMSVGTLVSGAKKISALAEKEILLGKSFQEKLPRGIKTEKHSISGVEVYSIKEIRNLEEDKAYVNKIVKRL